MIGLADGGSIKKGGTGVTPSRSARGRAASGLEITPILKSGKGIAALQERCHFDLDFYKRLQRKTKSCTTKTRSSRCNRFATFIEP
jgi:hypothetical protein